MSKTPITLVTNDDGIRAQGIMALLDGLDGHIDPLVVAPQNEQSGTSHAVNLRKDLHLKNIEDHMFALDGSPADCVLFAMRNLVRDKPDLCISGINHGANLGNDTLASGTVGAALAAATEGIPAMAVSMIGRGPDYHFTTAINVVIELLKKRHLIFNRIHAKVLNVNVPNIPANELKGVKLCKLGQRFWAEEFVTGKTAHSFRYCHQEPINFGGTGFDVTETDQGYASVSILQPSLWDETAHDQCRDLFA